MVQSPKPCLKVVGLHIEGLRALRRVDWPADGMGWNGHVPDLVMVGGVNGSGKTTLLDFIGDAARLGRGNHQVSWAREPDMNAWIDLRVSCEALGDGQHRVLFGDQSFVREHLTESHVAFARTTANSWQVSATSALYKTPPKVWFDEEFKTSDMPRILHLPTERRFELPDESFKSAGSLEDDGGFYYRFQPAKEWKDSIGALLYGARWADLNAKEEGHPERATYFDSYSRAFQVFFGDTKRLVWQEGKLLVRVADSSVLHPLGDLSSGEKQALILAAELHRRWRPGSLVLIDEPELHFHSSWQTALWIMLEQLQQERGGQVIVATQSNHLFGIAESGTTVLLRGSGL